VKARGAGIVDAHIGFESAPHNHFVAVQWNWDGEQFAAQEDERRAAVAPTSGNFQSIFIEIFAQLYFDIEQDKFDELFSNSVAGALILADEGYSGNNVVVTFFRENTIGARRYGDCACACLAGWLAPIITAHFVNSDDEPLRSDRMPRIIRRVAVREKKGKGYFKE
jgi:hypothetical protein